MSGRMDKAGSAREGAAEQGSGVAPMGTERARGEDTLKRYEALAGPWTIRVCPECGRVANACEHVEHAGVEPVEVEVAPSTTTGAVEALRKIDALLDEDITAGAFRLRCESLVPDALGPLGGRR